jgi:maltose O-acetyltransferase
MPILLQPRDLGAEIYIGKGSTITNGCELFARTAIRIGERCMVGPQTLILDSDFHSVAPNERHLAGKTAAVIIGDNVWVGTRVIILKGITVHRDAVIASGSVVAKDVDAGAIVGGNPARVIGSVYA